MTPFGRNFLPGPTDVHPEVLAAQVQPMFSHRGPRMHDILAEMQPSLQECFGTAQPVFISTSSGTGLIEAAIRSGVRRRVLVPVGGYFGEYMARIAESCGKEVFRVEIHPGTTISPGQLDQFLDGPAVDSVALVHSESSTGALADVRALADVVRARKDLLLIVDGVTSVGAMPIDMDRIGADYYCTGSQKAMALPPGLAFGAASPRFMARAEQQEDPGYYFAVKRLVEIARDSMPWWTPAVSLILALECQVRRVARRGGWPARWERHRRMLAVMEAWVAARNDVALLARGARSPAISAVILPQGRRPGEVIASMGQDGFQIGGPLDKSQPDIIRIGHMGDLEPEHLTALLDALAVRLT